MKAAINHIYSVEYMFMPIEKHSGIGSDTNQEFFSTRRDAEFDAGIKLSAPEGAPPLRAKEILSIKIRRHSVLVPNSPKQAWLDGRRSGRDDHSLEDVGTERAEVASVWTKDDGWLIKDDRSQSRRVSNAANTPEPF